MSNGQNAPDLANAIITVRNKQCIVARDGPENIRHIIESSIPVEHRDSIVHPNGVRCMGIHYQVTLTSTQEAIREAERNLRMYFDVLGRDQVILRDNETLVSVGYSLPPGFF